MSCISALRCDSLIDHHAGIFLVEVDLHFLDRLQAAGR